ncbi:MAG: hypothetical protein ACJAT7_001819 [Psychromonas sp.]|jgi:hypothetical protein|uniref:putative metalloprotease CJM1_0395 family protein n=1 Tax=Psychromonas sp. TaxID=1884585 RepID=UPI0039E2F5F9
MEILANNVPLKIANRSPVAANVAGDVGNQSANFIANVIPSVPAQVNISGGSVHTNIVANQTYERPTNKQVSDASNSPNAPNSPNSNASLKPTEDGQQGDSTDVQQKEATEQADKQAAKEKSNESSPEPINKNSTQEQYSDVELKQISALKIRDSEVLTHERAHSAVGGQYAGAPSYSYKTGPDGVKYAVGGEVSIDTSGVSNDPQATLQKAQQVKAAALAPAEPSGQDRRVAAKAEQMAAQARSDILQENQGNSGASTTRYESSVPEHLTGVQSLETERNVQKNLNNRIQQINNLYHNSSISKVSSTFQTQI